MADDQGTTDSKITLIIISLYTRFINLISLPLTFIKKKTIDDLILAACRNDQDEMLEDILKEGDMDINYADALGDTALHYT